MIVIKLPSGQYKIDPDTVQWTVYRELDDEISAIEVANLNEFYGMDFYQENPDQEYYRRAVDARVAAVLRDYPDAEVLMDTTDRSVPRGRPA